MLPFMLALYIGRLGEAGEPLQPRIDSETANHLGYIEQTLEGQDYILGENFTAADVQITLVLEAAERFGRLDDHPSLQAYLERMHSRPAYKQALEKGGDSLAGDDQGS